MLISSLVKSAVNTMAQWRAGPVPQHERTTATVFGDLAFPCFVDVPQSAPRSSFALDSKMLFVRQ